MNNYYLRVPISSSSSLPSAAVLHHKLYKVGKGERLFLGVYHAIFFVLQREQYDGGIGERNKLPW